MNQDDILDIELNLAEFEGEDFLTSFLLEDDRLDFEPPTPEHPMPAPHPTVDDLLQIPEKQLAFADIPTPQNHLCEQSGNRDTTLWTYIIALLIHPHILLSVRRVNPFVGQTLQEFAQPPLTLWEGIPKSPKGYTATQWLQAFELFAHRKLWHDRRLVTEFRKAIAPHTTWAHAMKEAPQRHWDLFRHTFLETCAAPELYAHARQHNIAGIAVATATLWTPPTPRMTGSETTTSSPSPPPRKRHRRNASLTRSSW